MSWPTRLKVVIEESFIFGVSIPPSFSSHVAAHRTYLLKERVRLNFMGITRLIKADCENFFFLLPFFLYMDARVNC